MKGVLLVPGAVLPKLQLGLRVTPVLVGGVVAALALRALQEQFDSNVTGHLASQSD